MADIEVEDAAEIGGAAGGAASAGKRFEVKKWNAVRARFARRLSRGASRSCMHACSSALVRTLRRGQRHRGGVSPLERQLPRIFRPRLKREQLPLAPCRRDWESWPAPTFSRPALVVEEAPRGVGAAARCSGCLCLACHSSIALRRLPSDVPSVLPWRDPGASERARDTGRIFCSAGCVVGMGHRG